MSALEYLDYLINTKRCEGGLHTIPIQESELLALRALIVAEKLLDQQLGV